MNPPIQTLKPGDKGEAVKQLQNWLVSQGYLTQAQMNTGPGIYGPKTKAAIAAYQAANGIDTKGYPGYYGPITKQYIANIQQPTTQPTQSTQQSITQPTKQVTLPGGQQVTINNKGDIVAGLDSLNKMLDAAKKSGMKVNPDLTPEDLKDLTLEDFMSQAESSIAPFYKQEFDLAKQDFSRILNQIKEGYQRNQEDIARQTEQAQLTGRQNLAERGLAFSGQRQQFETKITDAERRMEEANRRLSFNQAGQYGRTLERQLGTSNIQGLNVPQIEGRPLFNFSNEPIMGSLERARTTAIRSRAYNLLGNARNTERIRRSFA